MPSPRSLVLALYNHWDVVEWLVRASRELPAFEESQLLHAVARFSPSWSADACAEVVRGLISNDVLQLLPRSSHFQLNPYVLEFVRGLSCEHELSLSAILQARVQAVRDATSQLNDGLQQRDMDLLREAARTLAELFRQITRQLEQDRHAILDLAAQAKSADSNMPLARRYRAVLDAYSQYVEPMNQMMDTGPSGSFYRYLEMAAVALDHASEQQAIQGALYTHLLQLRQVAYQAKELQRLGRVVAQQCSDTLLPLREELRLHSELSAAISSTLAQVRKRGLARALRLPSGPASLLPVWKQERQRRVGVGDEVLAIMAEALDFRPQKLEFPAEAAILPGMQVEVVNEAALYEHLQRCLPVASLLDWLKQHYPGLQDATLLRLYHQILAEPDWCATQADAEVAVELLNVRVRHYPHSLNQP